MQNLVFALVLTNLGLAAWYAEPQSSSGSLASPSAPSITLISELEEAAFETIEEPTETLPESALPVAVAEATDAQRFVSVGPFEELAQASAALRDAGLLPSQRVVDGESWVGYWVYLPDIPTRDEASEILREFHANDMSDSYNVPRGEESQMGFLGVFSEIGRAGSIREQVRELGYDPTVLDRSRGATIYWIDVLADNEVDIGLDVLQVPGRTSRLEQRLFGSVG